MKHSTENLDNEQTEEKTRRRFLLRYYRVWNLEQCELPQAVLYKLPKIETHEHDPIEAAERIIAGMPTPPEIQHTGSKAFYSPITDRITLPPRELFASVEEYYATALHETVHSSGSQKRLAREGICESSPFGSPLYSKEEMIAEMGAAYLCAESGISNAVIENQAAYVAGWLRKLRDDRRLLINAAAQAQQAADYILCRLHLSRYSRRPRDARAPLTKLVLLISQEIQPARRTRNGTHRSYPKRIIPDHAE